MTVALESLPIDKPFDAQALFGNVALEIALLFITGPRVVHELSRDGHWKETKESIGRALADGQRVMGRRLKVGSIWVRPFVSREHAYADQISLFLSYVEMD